ncbi:site-2 protease family protein [Aggregicoccus sp. 17bor-14]|uniref:site-2 protease family protein n=1 Tax=Myxococcaceae TaxID=31 RepID=UPI00129CC5C6|nr:MULTISPECIES: site-2 protease family protein [Myxococcaceae]MBF5041739.1 site-2 protease family protein [Simulacricoccus sp. 17bor-14]MRI87520.1 site-2 protease family protein [Aggregicoccus sp. 17bor-14]
MATALFRPGDRPLLNLALVVLTLGTTFLTFLWWFFGLWGGEWLQATAPQLQEAATFALCTVAILGAHEMGHYVLARVHGVDSSLPYFIPLPFLGFGTMGAVIRLRAPIPSRNALVDIGAAGPLAGLAVALPVLFWSFRHAVVVDATHLPVHFPAYGSLLHVGAELFAFVRDWLAGVAPPAHTQEVTVFGDPLLLLAVRHLALGALPAGKDVAMSAPMLAAWFGLLVTLLNLMPVGQLDGGHVAFAVLGRRARAVGKAVALLLLVLTVFVQWTWVVWLLVAGRFVGFGHPQVLVPEEALSPGRRVVSALCLLALVGCAMPVPITTVFR